MKHSFIDKYSDRDSAIHRLDPRTKIIAFFSFAVAVVLTPAGKFMPLAGLMVLVAFLVLMSRLPVAYVALRACLVIPFSGLAALYMAAGRGFNGQLLAMLLAKSWLAACGLVLLSSTTPFAQLLKGLEKLYFPKTLLQILAFMYRYVFILIDEAMAMDRARRSRYFGGHISRQVRAFSGMVVALFLRAYERGERVYAGMVARNFDGEVRTLDRLEFRRRDIVFSILFFMCLSAVVFGARRSPGGNPSAPAGGGMLSSVPQRQISLDQEKPVSGRSRYQRSLRLLPEELH